MVQITRRSFIATLTGALAIPRMALPAPPPDMQSAVAPELVAFCESVDDSVLLVRTRVVLIGDLARDAIARNPHMWSAVMVSRRLT